MHFAHPGFLFLWLLIPVALWLESRLHRWRSSARERFAEVPLHARLLFRQTGWWKIMRWGLVYAALVAALARPQGSPTVAEGSGQTQALMVLLDCSLSMQAEDVRPNRLGMAKETIRTLSEAMPEHYIGLILFSGTALEVCPPTVDHQALDMALRQAQGSLMEKPGSNPAAAIGLGLEGLRRFPAHGKVLLLITDGEVTQGAPLDEASRQASQAGVVLFCLGVGTEEGARIPLGTDFWGRRLFRKHQGKEVRTRLMPAVLHRAAVFGHGQYQPPASSFEAARRLAALITKRAAQVSSRRQTIVSYQEYFSWLVILAWVLLWCETWFSGPTRRSRP